MTTLVGHHGTNYWTPLATSLVVTASQRKGVPQRMVIKEAERKGNGLGCLFAGGMHEGCDRE